MKLQARLFAIFKANPLAWVLAALLAAVEFANYQRGAELTRVCELTSPHDFSYDHPATNKQELDTICAGRWGDDD
jgi:hypothetical protein